jgi:hypothetical protein
MAAPFVRCGHATGAAVGELAPQAVDAEAELVGRDPQLARQAPAGLGALALVPAVSQEDQAPLGGRQPVEAGPQAGEVPLVVLRLVFRLGIGDGRRRREGALLGSCDRAQ